MEPSPGLGEMIGRALARRCPRCGGGPVYRRWMVMAETCPSCGLRFEREQGYWVGAITIDTAATFALFGLLVIGMIAATLPEVPWTALMVTALVVNGVFPILFYPYARLLWVAMDLRVRPVE